MAAAPGAIGRTQPSSSGQVAAIIRLTIYVGVRPFEGERARAVIVWFKADCTAVRDPAHLKKRMAGFNHKGDAGICLSRG